MVYKTSKGVKYTNMGSIRGCYIRIHKKGFVNILYTTTPQLPFKTSQIPSNRDHKALDRGTLGV